MSQKLVSDIEVQLNEFARLNIKDCLRNNNFGTSKIVSCLGLRGATLQDGKGMLYYGMNLRIQNVLGETDLCIASFDMWPNVAKPGQALKAIKGYLRWSQSKNTLDLVLSQMKTEFDQSVRERLLSKSDAKLKDMLSDLQGIFSFEHD